MSTISAELKIKNKSLAAEAVIIRQEEAKLKRQERWHREHAGKDTFKTVSVTDINGKVHEHMSGGWTAEAIAIHNQIKNLSDHRRGIVRDVRRASHLAYCFLRGTPYLSVESKAHTEPDWGAVERMAKRYGGDDERVIAQKFAEWKSHYTEA